MNINERHRIGFVTSGRSDYALIRPLLRKLHQHKDIMPWVIVTGTHMTKLYGKTIQEVDWINDRVDILMQSNNAVSTANAIGLGVIKFSELFIKRNFKALFLVGDRFEMFAAGVAGYCLGIPIIHAFGGEETKGSQDDGWRNCLTIYADHHLVSHAQYAERIKQIKGFQVGVRTVGSLSVDNINSTRVLSQEELATRIKLGMGKFLLVTYHPDTTKDRDQNIKDFQEVLAGLDKLDEYDIVITFANQDTTGAEFNRMIMEFKGPRYHVKYLRSAGVEVYLSLMKHAEAVIGNSSSGIMEAPYYGTPTINIGERQYGRVMADSITSVACDSNAIFKAVKESKRSTPCGVFGQGAADNIIKYLEEFICQNK